MIYHQIIPWTKTGKKERVIKGTKFIAMKFKKKTNKNISHFYWKYCCRLCVFLWWKYHTADADIWPHAVGFCWKPLFVLFCFVLFMCLCVCFCFLFLFSKIWNFFISALVVCLFVCLFVFAFVFVLFYTFDNLLFIFFMGELA